MPDDARSPRVPVLTVAGVAAVFALMWALRGALGPFWIAAAGVALVWPVRREPAARAALWAGAILFGAYLADRLAGPLAPFLGVFVAAYLLDPVVGWAETKGVPRAASSLALALVATAAVVGAAVLLVPAAAAQAERLAAQAIALTLQAPGWAAESAALARLEEAGLLDRAAVVAEVTTLVPAQIEGALARIPDVIGGALRQVGAILGLVTTAALVPVLLFFTLKDFPALSAALVRLLPRYDGRRAYLDRAAAVFGGYVRGVLVISAASAVLVAVPLTLLGVPYALLLGLAAGLLNLIPSLGSVLTYVLGVVLMLAFGTWADLAIVLVVLAVQALIEQAVLTPKVMSAQVGLHPVVILAALFSAGALFGLLGLVLAVPAAALAAGVVRAHREALVIDLGDGDDGAPPLPA